MTITRHLPPRGARPGILLWNEETGIGRTEEGADEAIYGKSYWLKYVGYAKTPMGRALTAARIDLVDRHVGSDAEVLDVGIGAGQFVETRGRTMGYDVNPLGMLWLKDRDLWRDPHLDGGVERATCWDVLEHMDDPGQTVKRVRSWCFVSIPIFRDPEHIFTSRHWRPGGEHVWYFTRNGLIRWFKHFGFTLAEANDMETKLGREGIGSFAFVRT